MSVRRHLNFGSTPSFQNLYKEINKLTDNKGRLAYANYDPSLGEPPTEEQVELLQNYKCVMPTITFTGSEKLHGCLRGDTKIETKEFGVLPINSIVDNNIICSVLTYNHDTNKQEWKEVTGRSVKDEPEKDWYEVITDSGEVLIITGNHKVWIESSKEYISIDTLYKDDTKLHTVVSCF